MDEFWGVHESLRYAISFVFRAIKLNVHSLVVDNALIRNGKGSYGKVFEKIRRMIGLVWEVIRKHSYREAITNCKCFSQLCKLIA
jgi:hypothetical protein